MAISY